VLAADIIKENIDGGVAVGSLDLHGFINIELKDLELRNEENDSVWLRISDARITVEPFGLLTGNLHVSNMTITDFYINYAHVPEFKAAPVKDDELSEGIKLPVDLIVDRFDLRKLAVSGPEAEIVSDLYLSEIKFSDQDKFSALYSLVTNKGLIHYYSEDFSLDGTCEISANGEISSSKNALQEFKASLSNLKIFAGESLFIDNLALALNTTSRPGENLIAVNDFRFELDDKEILGFTGEIKLEETPELSLQAKTKSWDVSAANSFLNDLNIPLLLSGNISIESFKLFGSPSYFAYDFTINLRDMGIGYDNAIFLGGLDGSVYSGGEPGLAVFGSSLTADSISGMKDSGQLFGVYKLSSAVEAEISSSDVYFNITTGIADFFGGEFDIFAFTESSKIDGDLRIENVNLSRAVSTFLAGEDVDFSGLFDMTLKVSGEMDSLMSDVSASLENLKIRFEDDSLYIPRQDFNFSASTIIDKESINSNFTYNLHKSISGSGEFLYPLKAAPLDSIIMSYKMNLDNSVLPSYLPAAALDALGAVELSGGSVIDGRFSSPIDTFIFTGSSKLTIEPTDILIDDFQSVLYSLISVSEFEVTERGISLFSNSGIEDLLIRHGV